MFRCRINVYTNVYHAPSATSAGQHRVARASMSWNHADASWQFDTSCTRSARDDALLVCEFLLSYPLSWAIDQ